LIVGVALQHRPHSGHQRSGPTQLWLSRRTGMRLPVTWTSASSPELGLAFSVSIGDAATEHDLVCVRRFAMNRAPRRHSVRRFLS
jgi:hypothetical protein